MENNIGCNTSGTFWFSGDEQHKVFYPDDSKHRTVYTSAKIKKQRKSHPLALLGECSCGIMGKWVHVDVEPFVILSSKAYISQASLVLHVAVLCLQTNSTINGGTDSERSFKNRSPRNKKQRPCSRRRQLEKFLPTALNKGHDKKQCLSCCSICIKLHIKVRVTRQTTQSVSCKGHDVSRERGRGDLEAENKGCHNSPPCCKTLPRVPCSSLEICALPATFESGGTAGWNGTNYIRLFIIFLCIPHHTLKRSTETRPSAEEEVLRKCRAQRSLLTLQITCD